MPIPTGRRPGDLPSATSLAVFTAQYMAYSGEPLLSSSTNLAIVSRRHCDLTPPCLRNLFFSDTLSSSHGHGPPDRCMADFSASSSKQVTGTESRHLLSAYSSKWSSDCTQMAWCFSFSTSITCCPDLSSIAVGRSDPPLWLLISVLTAALSHPPMVILWYLCATVYGSVLTPPPAPPVAQVSSRSFTSRLHLSCFHSSS